MIIRAICAASRSGFSAISPNTLQVLEKDFVHPAYRDASSGRMFFHLTETASLEKLEDIVDDTIERVLEQGGDVIFPDNEKLEKFQRIALMTRY